MPNAPLDLKTHLLDPKDAPNGLGSLRAWSLSGCSRFASNIVQGAIKSGFDLKLWFLEEEK